MLPVAVGLVSEAELQLVMVPHGLVRAVVASLALATSVLEKLAADANNRKRAKKMIFASTNHNSLSLNLGENAGQPLINTRAMLR